MKKATNFIACCCFAVNMFKQDTSYLWFVFLRNTFVLTREAWMVVDVDSLSGVGNYNTHMIWIKFQQLNTCPVVFCYWTSDDLHILITCVTFLHPCGIFCQVVYSFYFGIILFFSIVFKVTYFQFCMFILEKVIFCWVSWFKLSWYLVLCFIFFLFPFCF